MDQQTTEPKTTKLYVHEDGREVTVSGRAWVMRGKDGREIASGEGTRDLIATLTVLDDRAAATPTK